MFVVGLTGGIGSGKSAAAACFAALGVPVVDTDFIAHQLTAPGMPVIAQIAEALGNDCIAPDGSLDRAKLRRKVFADLIARKTLEGILHPLIRAVVAAELSKHPEAPYQVVVVPLLFEAGGYQDIIDCSLVIDCSEAEQVRRATARSGLSAEEVRTIMAAQMPRTKRLARADDIILNDGSLQELAEKIQSKHEKYINTCIVRQSTT